MNTTTTLNKGAMTMMTQEQIKWASRHDWYLQSLGDAVLVVEVERLSVDSLVSLASIKFTSYKELRQWAGY